MVRIIVKVSDRKLPHFLIVLKLFRTIFIKEIVQSKTILPGYYAEGINRLIRQYNKGKIRGSEYDLGIKVIIKSLDDERKIEQKRKREIGQN